MHARSIAACLALFFSGVSLGLAQKASKPPQPTDWGRIERLDPGTEIHVTYKAAYIGRTVQHIHRESEVCNFASATDDQISCVKTRRIFFVPMHTDLRIPRDQVLRIRHGRTDASSFLGGLIGIAAGAAVSAILIAAGNETDHSEDGILYILLGGVGYSIGSQVGRHTDFAGGPVLYVAP